MDPVISQEFARRDHLGAQGVWTLPVHFAEIGGFASPHQRLEAVLLRGAHDLDLKIPAARRPAAIVGRAAGCADAGIGPGMDRKLSRRAERRRQVTGHHPPGFHDPEPVSRLPPRLGDLGSLSGQGTAVPVGLAPRSAVPFFLEVPAGHVQHRVGIELVVVAPEGAEADPLGVAQEPRRLMIAGPGPLVEYSDAEQNRKGGALPSHGSAGRSGGTSGGWHVAKIGEERDPVAYRFDGLYICELVHKGAPNPVPGAGRPTISPS